MHRLRDFSLFAVPPALRRQGHVIVLGLVLAAGLRGAAAAGPNPERERPERIAAAVGDTDPTPPGTGAAAADAVPEELPAPAEPAIPPGPWGQAIADAAREAGVAPELVAAVVEVESGGRADARSPVGAMGLMQLMPATAASLGVDNPVDPVQNLRGGARYLASLIKRFERIDLALAAYNAGPTVVARVGGIPNYPETQQYVAKVLSRLPQ